MVPEEMLLACLFDWEVRFMWLKLITPPVELFIAYYWPLFPV